MFWENLREEEFEGAVEKTGGVCVIPIGCMEAHGQHLPVGTDCIEAEKIVEMAAELEPICIFPSFKFGNVTGLVDFKGSVILKPALLIELLENLCDEIARNGFKKILFVNSHGGNKNMLSYLTSALQYKYKDYVVLTQSPSVTIKHIYRDILENGAEKYPELSAEEVAVIKKHVEEQYEDGHGGIVETSMVMAERPETVRLDRAIPDGGLSTHLADDLSKTGVVGGLWNVNYPNSYCGEKVELSTENIGKVLLRVSAEKVAAACKAFKQAESVVSYFENKKKFYQNV